MVDAAFSSSSSPALCARRCLSVFLPTPRRPSSLSYAFDRFFSCLSLSISLSLALGFLLFIIKESIHPICCYSCSTCIFTSENREREKHTIVSPSSSPLASRSVTMSSMTNNPLEISSFYSHLSMMPSLMNAGPKLPPNIYRPNSWMDPAMQPFFYYNLA